MGLQTDVIESVDIDYVIGLRDDAIEDTSPNLPIRRLRRYLKVNNIEHTCKKDIDKNLWEIIVNIDSITGAGIEIEDFLTTWNVSGYSFTGDTWDAIEFWSDIPFEDIDCIKGDDYEEHN